MPPLQRNGSPEGVEHQPDRIAHLLPPGMIEGQYTGVMNDPPPGLVRAMPPVPLQNYHEFRDQINSQRRDMDENQVAVFGDAAEYFDTGFDIYGNTIRLDLTCQICHENWLDVPEHISPIRDPNDSEWVEPMAILPCGHFFGGRCLDQWFRTRRDAHLHLECPTCRYKCIHTRCRHDIRIRHYDARFPRFDQLPLTIPEGGVIPVDCFPCRQERLKDLSIGILSTIYPSDVPESAFIDTERCGAPHFKQLATRMWDDILDAFQWCETRYSHW
ncbi:hypothetical protein F4677DRAFT_419817 [Hypoxylon crocopeplum]|nr:hypothetical protein F4677DRAFT_419817 [Hypoxylon crocopeplum]